MTALFDLVRVIDTSSDYNGRFGRVVLKHTPTCNRVEIGYDKYIDVDSVHLELMGKSAREVDDLYDEIERLNELAKEAVT